MPAKVVHLDDAEPLPGPGTLVDGIPDPEPHQHAVTAEAGTTVLGFGGPPTVGPSEWEGRCLRERRGASG